MGGTAKNMGITIEGIDGYQVPEELRAKFDAKQPA